MKLKKKMEEMSKNEIIFSKLSVWTKEESLPSFLKQENLDKLSIEKYVAKTKFKNTY